MYDNTQVTFAIENSMSSDSGQWINEAYRTVTFLEPPTGDLLKWLQKNAVKQ
nr:MAG TPA: hypothetical protein [Caudoviricetes sp.]